MRYLFTTLALFAPSIVFAAPQTFTDLALLFVDYINLAIPIVIALAVLGFFWGVSKYVLAGDDSSRIEQGRKIIIWGIIALFIAVSIWGILQLLVNTFLDAPLHPNSSVIIGI